MRQFLTIASNAFMELVRQPVFLLLMTAVVVFDVFLASVPYFGFGDDPKLVKDSVLAVMLVSGLFGAVLSASASVAHEIRSGTALAVLAKPIGRAQFILAKYLGVAGALTLLTYVSLVGALLASRMAFDAYGDADKFALKLFFAFLVLAYLCGGFTNYFLHRPFVSDAVFAVVVMVTLAFVVINCFDKEGALAKWAKDVDWKLIPAAILILFALWILAGLAIACSTRWDMIPTLAICSGFFLLGLMSDYFFQARSNEGVWWAKVLYTALPNWQLFWLADALEGQKSIPWGYVGKAFGYVVGYLGAALAVALALFEDRELS
ncbi:MAG: ABC-2 transporter permease [Verrucomicrobia bacterium]|nr:ABC-2 transporter permease [Verrucomicrobiota bacterium]